MSRRIFYLIFLAVALAVPAAGLLFFQDKLPAYLSVFPVSFLSAPVIPAAVLPEIQAPPPGYIPPAVTVHIVTITAEGFDPKSLTISVGDAVRWINRDTVLHWPASDPHPTHTGEPGFDAAGNLAFDEIYAHVFDKSGNFVYHDHAQALTGSTSTITGLIKVK